MAKCNGICKLLLNAVAANTDSESIEIDNDVKTILISGTFTANVQPQGSPDGGTTWVNIGSPFSTSGGNTFTTAMTRIRLNVNTFVSGTITAYLCG